MKPPVVRENRWNLYCPTDSAHRGCLPSIVLNYRPDQPLYCPFCGAAAERIEGPNLTFGPAVRLDRVP